MFYFTDDKAAANNDDDEDENKSGEDSDTDECEAEEEEQSVTSVTGLVSLKVKKIRITKDWSLRTKGTMRNRRRKTLVITRRKNSMQIIRKG